MSAIHLFEQMHPRKDAAARYEALSGLEIQKQSLLDELGLLLNESRLKKWLHRHHPKGLSIVATLSEGSPLVILSGEVGCGKTALATSIATPLAHALDRRIVSLETPSDIRGTGLVGELSARITEAFEQAFSRVRQVDCGLLIIDEADDLATARAQMQAHHEDRAGVNVLIKQIDRIVREKVSLVVLLITNRARALDPAVVRRASLHLRFERPNPMQRREVFERLLAGASCSNKDLESLVGSSEPREGTPFSFSDLTVRLGRAALRRALRVNKPFGPEILLGALQELEPSPLVASSMPLVGINDA